MRLGINTIFLKWGIYTLKYILVLSDIYNVIKNKLFD
jgi:hypothetical protein